MRAWGSFKQIFMCFRPKTLVSKLNKQTFFLEFETKFKRTDASQPRRSELKGLYFLQSILKFATSFLLLQFHSMSLRSPSSFFDHCCIFNIICKREMIVLWC